MPGPRGLVQQVDQAMHQSGLLPRGGRLLVAVSGGADSVALLRLMVAINGSDHWGWKLVVGHVDHGIRGAESRADERFVAGLAKGLKLPYVGARLKLGAAASENAARQGRLKALTRMVRDKKCAGVVMAHHADDQAETMLMRMMRGCGIDGLGAMGACVRIGKLVVYRPLLDVRRRELRAFLAESGQTWREDQTNASTQYLRNRVRATVMPMLEVIWPQGVSALGRLAKLAGEAQEVIDEAVEACLRKTPMRLGKSGVFLSRAGLRVAPMAVASEVLRRAVEAAGENCEVADFERIREALRMVRGRAGGKRVELGGGIVVMAEGDRVSILRAKKRRGG